MPTETTTQIISEAPPIEAYKTGVYQTGLDYVKKLQEAGILPPSRGIAGLSSETMAAGDMLRAGIGGYEPYLQGALGSLQGAKSAIGSGAMPAMSEALAQQGASIAGLQRAGGLADRTRGIPYQTRMEALRGLNRAGAGIPGIMGATQQNIYGAAQSLGGTGGQFDPNTIQNYMNPYTQQVIDAEQAELARLGEQQKVGARSQGVRSGAFGGSRSGIQEAEIGRNVLQQQARTGAQLRTQGYQQAAQQAQQAYEQSQQRRQQGAGLRGQLAQMGGQMGLAGQQSLADMAMRGGQLGLQYGQLGQADVDQMARLAQARGQAAQGIGSLAYATGQLGQGLGRLGQAEAGLGGQAQAMRGADIQALMGYGGMTQQQAQNVLNNQFAADQTAYQTPFQQIGFLSDLTKALPSSQGMIQSSQQPSPGWGQQVAGMGMGIMGMRNAGMFGGGGGGYGGYPV